MNKEHLLEILVHLDYQPLCIYPVSKKEAIKIFAIKHTKKQLEKIIIDLLKKTKK
jgi:hypothetical protein